jgi:hypothetical protein
VPIANQTGVLPSHPSKLGLPALATSLLYLADRPATGKGVLKRAMLPTEMVSSIARTLQRRTLRTGIGWTVGEGDSIGQFQQRAMHEAAMVIIDSLDA